MCHTIVCPTPTLRETIARPIRALDIIILYLLAGHAHCLTPSRSARRLLIHQICCADREGVGRGQEGIRGRMWDVGCGVAHMCLVIRCRNYFTRLSHYVGASSDVAGKLHKCRTPNPDPIPQPNRTASKRSVLNPTMHPCSQRHKRLGL